MNLSQHNETLNYAILIAKGIMKSNSNFFEKEENMVTAFIKIERGIDMLEESPKKN
jgi:hypothetical protein